MNPPESYEQATDYLNDLYQNMKRSNPRDSFKDIISKMGDKILYDFMYTFKVSMKTIGEIDHQFFILDYRDGSKTWHEWARKGRGTALYFDHETEKFIVLKQLLQRGTEILTNALKKRGVEETQDVVQGDLPFSRNILDTMEILDQNKPFPGFLSMKVDGSLTSITFLELGSEQSNQIDKLFSVSDPNIEIIIGKKISDICKKFRMNGFMSTKGTILMGGSMIHWNLGCMVCDVLGIKWEDLKKELEDKGLINNPNNAGLFHLIDKYFTEIMARLINFTKKAMPGSQSHTLMFESVCPNRVDIFNTNTHTELAVSYKIPLFRFLGITSGFGESAGIFKPHCDPDIQKLVVKFKLNDPLFWSNERMTASQIEILLNDDLEMVINGGMSESDYIVKNKPKNSRKLNDYEPLDFEGFILYRLLPNGFYEYNKIKHHLYYTFHKLDKAIERGRVTDEYLMSLSDYVSEVFPSLKIYKVFKSKFNEIYLQAINEFRNFLIEKLFILEPSEEKLVSIEPFKSTPKMLNAYIKAKTIVRIKMIQKYIRNILPDIIENKFKEGGIIIEANTGRTEAENLNSKKRFNDTLNGVLTIRNLDLVAENWVQQIEPYLGEIGKTIYPFIKGTIESKQITSSSDKKISLNFISFNIMSKVMYSTKNNFVNAHGLIPRNQRDEITEEENDQRLSKVKEIISNHKADIVFLQEANEGWPGNVMDLGEYQLVSDKSLFGLKCNHQYARNRKKKSHTQRDATQIFYNPERFKLLDSESGCFGRITHRRSDKMLLDPFDSGNEPTGTGYAFGLVEDLQSGERIFLVNIHVKILDWSADNYPIDKVAAEFVQHFNLFLGEIGRVEPTDKLLIAGDFNADDRIYHGHTDYTSYDELNQRNWREFMDYVFSRFERVFGRITEVEKGLVSSVHCKGDKGNQDDHIFINQSFDTDIVSHKNRLYPLLINCMNSYNFEEFSQRYSAKKREYQELVGNSGTTLEQIRRVSKEMQEFIDMKNAIKINNIIRRNGLAVSDHYPKIVTLTYKSNTPMQITQMPETKTVEVRDEAGPGRIKSRQVRERATSPPRGRQVREQVTSVPIMGTVEQPRGRQVRERPTSPPRMGTIEPPKLRSGDVYSMAGLLQHQIRGRQVRERATSPPRGRQVREQVTSVPIMGTVEQPRGRQVREQVTSAPIMGTVEPPRQVREQVTSAPKQTQSATASPLFMTPTPTPQVGGKPKVLVLYPISTIGVGKNYLFDRLAPQLESENTVVYNIESDQYDKGQFGTTAAKMIKEHFKKKDTKGKNVILILNKNFPPNAWKVTKELKALEGELKKLENVEKIGIGFPKDINSSFDENELFVTLQRVMQRRNHPKEVDGDHPNIVMLAYMAITIQAWNISNIRKEMNNLRQNYNDIKVFNWLTDSQRANISEFLRTNPKYLDFISFIKSYRSPLRFGIDIEHFILEYNKKYPDQDLYDLLKEIEAADIMTYGNVNDEILRLSQEIKALL
jgi:hypothetical protein